MLTPDLFQNCSSADSNLALCGRLSARQTLRFCPRTAGVVRVTGGRLWLTTDGPHAGPANAWGDHVLYAGQSMTLCSGQGMVIEAWPVTEGVVSQFEWLIAPTFGGALTSFVKKQLTVRPRNVLRPWSLFKHLLGL